MAEFDLLNINLKKDSLTGKASFTESIHFKISMAVVCSSIITIFVLDNLDYSLPEWTDFIFGAGMVIGYTYAFIALFFSRNAGKVILSEHEIQIHPKKEPGKYPPSPIQLDEHSEIKISTIQSFRFLLIRTLLHVEISKDGSEQEFGMIIKGKNKQTQYLEVLESWYRADRQVKEFDQIGNRIFKLKEENYAEVQKIKKEYGIDW